MAELLTLIVLVFYFSFLYLISRWTKGNEDNDTFLEANLFSRFQALTNIVAEFFEPFCFLLLFPLRF